MSGRSEPSWSEYCYCKLVLVLLHDCHALQYCAPCSYYQWTHGYHPVVCPTLPSALIVYTSHGEVDGWGVSAWWPIHREAQKLFVVIIAAMRRHVAMRARITCGG